MPYLPLENESETFAVIKMLQRLISSAKEAPWYPTVVIQLIATSEAKASRVTVATRTFDLLYMSRYYKHSRHSSVTLYAFHFLLEGVSLFTGLDHWTGLLDWTTGLTSFY